MYESNCLLHMSQNNIPFQGPLICDGARLILDKNSNSTDVMRWDMSVMFAKAYVLQLSDNVKRSLEQSRKEGISS